MNLCSERDLRSLLARHGFRFSKSMGQNFLINPQVPADIAAACGADQSCAVVEIGPGVGALTVELSQRAGRVIAIELDKALLPLLGESLAGRPNVTVIPGDALKLDLAQLLAVYGDGLTPVVCANLPYNITSPVLTRLLEGGLFRDITVMLQREVARRICAAPGTADYGAFSVFCQYHADCEVLFDVPPEAFLPAPKVTSSVIRMITKAPPILPEYEELFFRTVRGSFALRRKTLANSLASAFGELTKEQITRAIAACGLPERVRGESLDIPALYRLALALGAAIQG